MALYTVMIVDDEILAAKSIARILRADNHKIIIASGGEDALVKLQNNNVELVISDQRMPGMTGVELLTKVRSRYPDIITIMLTAHTDLEPLMKAVNDAGIYKFILKPWDEYDLRMTIMRALEFRRLELQNKSLTLAVKKKALIFNELEKGMQV